MFFCFDEVMIFFDALMFFDQCPTTYRSDLHALSMKHVNIHCETVKNQANQLLTKFEVGFAAISDKQFAYCAVISSGAMAAIFATVLLWGTATWQV